MIELNADNDPMLFAVTIPAGQLIVQYMEVIATIHAGMSPDTEPKSEEIVAAIRKASRTPEVAAAASDAHLIAAWARMSQRVASAGNG